VRAGYRVSIIAQDAARKPYLRDGVQIIPTGMFGRLSWRRIWSAFKMERLARRLGADVYQVHTVELLGVAKKLKRRLPRCKVIYDVHEDYAANIQHADYYAERLRPHLIQRVREAQDDFCRWGDAVIYAEDCFRGIMNFDPDATVVVRNRYQAPRSQGSARVALQHPALPMMLYTGTISENWGILRAIHLWAMLNRDRPVNLVVAGHAQDRRLLADLQLRIQESGFRDRFAMVGGEVYLPYEEVVAWIEACTFGVALYQLQENIRDRIPTKFYEYMALGKPLVFTQNPTWDSLNARFPFGSSLAWPLVDPSSGAEVWDRLDVMMRASRRPIPGAVWSWEEEAPRMLALLRRLTPS
jgi:glycosyltransferase involved in cell wall biosynthesis